MAFKDYNGNALGKLTLIKLTGWCKTFHDSQVDFKDTLLGT